MEKEKEKEKITFTEFLEIESKLEIKYGYILIAERIPKSTKLLKLDVMFDTTEPSKTVVTNLGETFQPEEFEGLTLPFITNLQPTKMMGVMSEAMIMVPQNNGTIELKNPSSGSKLL